MKRQKLTAESSNVVSVGYDETSRVLEIEFTRRAVYQYVDVPPAIYEGLLAADSPGKYLNANVRGFRYEKVSG